MVPNRAKRLIFSDSSAPSGHLYQISNYRSSHLHIFLKIVVLKNFANISEKHLCCSFFCKKLQAFRCASLLKEAPTQVFPREVYDIFKNTLFTESLR